MKPGYTLTGWVQDKNLSDNTFFGTTPYAPGQKVLDPVGDVHMTAQWEVKEYTIRFHYADAKPGTDPIFTQTYTVESKDLLHALPTPTGYNVTGWRTGDTVDAEGNWKANTDYAVGTLLTGMYGDVDLYCTRKAKDYNISYMNGESIVESGTYTIEDEVTIRPAPDASAVDGKGKAQFFTGWTAAPEEASDGWTSGGTYNPGDKVGPGAYGHVTLTAGFEFRTLTLYARSAGSNKENQYHVKDGYNGKSFEDYFYESYEAPSRKGWTLTGWYTVKDGTVQKVLDADGSIVKNDDGTNVESIPGFITDGMLKLEEDQTLYARWTRKVNVFAKTDFPTDGGTVMIGSEDKNGLHLLIAKKGKNGKYSLDVETVVAENSRFYSDSEELVNGNWDISGVSGSSGDCSIVVSGTTEQYLAREWNWNWNTWKPVVKNKPQAGDSWIVMVDGDNRVNSVYFTYEIWHGQFYTETYYLSVTDSGAKISSDESAISFYTIQNVEEESYD